MTVPRLHAATIVGRVRSDPGLLLLMGLVVALTTALTAAVTPLTERTADRAVAATVREAGPAGAVVATMPEGYDDPRGRKRAPRSAVELRQDAGYARSELPPSLAEVLLPPTTTLTTPPLQLLDDGPGRYLRLTYVETPDGAPSVTYTAGGPPRASVGADRADLKLPPGAGPWPVQVALSQAVAKILGLRPGDRLSAEDEQHREVRIRINGVFVATDPADEAWRERPDLLTPTQGVAEGIRRTFGTALASSASLPDLRLAVPADDLTQRVVFMPSPSRLRWRETPELERAVVSLQSSVGLARGEIAWSSLLDHHLAEGRDRVASARGQAEVLLVGLLACAFLVLVLAAQLLVRRRTGSVVMARERGGSLLGVGGELLVEALGVALAGAVVGAGVTRLLVGDADWGASWPVLVVAALAAPVLGVVVAASATGGRRVPANRSARRTADRARRVRRWALESAVIAAAVLSFVALRQRGVVADADGDVTAASAATWWSVAGALVVLRLLPPAARLSLRTARRTVGGVRFLVASRLTETGARALPLLVVSVAVAQLAVGVALAATEQEGQSAGALLAVGGDARLTTAPGPAAADTAREVADAPGVSAAAAALVVDGVPASSRASAEAVRLVVVDAAAYEDVLASSALPDAPQLARLSEDRGAPVPALLVGGDADLRDGLVVRWEDTSIALEVVGSAPRVGAAPGVVVVVDARAFAGAGAVAEPDTVWAVGPGAPAALEEHASESDTVTRYSDDLDSRRHAPLASGLVWLAVASSSLLLLFAILGVVLAAATEAPARGESLGRLRALGLRDRDLRRVLAGELLTPVVVAALAGLALGVGCAYATFGSLSLERITGQTGPPHVVVPWWLAAAAVALVATVLAVVAAEWRALRRRVLAELLRS